MLLGLRIYEELGSEADSAGSGGGPFGGRGPAALLVEAATPDYRTFDRSLDVLGEIQAQARVEVMSRISGRLEKVLVDRGDPVKEGQLVATVEDEDLQQQIRRSEASIEVARAGSRREEATLENLRIQLRRFETLHDEDLISIQDLQDLQSRVRVAESQLELAVAQVRQAEAALRELKIQQAQASIYSPLNGLVGIRHLDPGALVSPSVPIVSVLKLDRVKTIIPIPESTLKSVTVGLEAGVSVDAFPDQSYKGRITRISPFLNPETRTADVEIDFPNPGGRLRPGMFARVRIEADLQEQVLAIPRTALIQRGEQKGVFLITADLDTAFKAIEIGRIQDGYVEVVAGLDPSSRLVTTGAQNLNDGDRVRFGESSAMEAPNP